MLQYIKIQLESWDYGSVVEHGLECSNPWVQSQGLTVVEVGGQDS
jgi:hypothetical protein